MVEYFNNTYKNCASIKSLVLGLPNEVLYKTDEVYPIIETIINEFISEWKDKPEWSVVNKEIDLSQVQDSKENSIDHENHSKLNDTEDGIWESNWTNEKNTCTQVTTQIF